MEEHKVDECEKQGEEGQIVQLHEEPTLAKEWMNVVIVTTCNIVKMLYLGW